MYPLCFSVSACVKQETSASLKMASRDAASGSREDDSNERSVTEKFCAITGKHIYPTQHPMFVHLHVLKWIIAILSIRQLMPLTKSKTVELVERLEDEVEETNFEVKSVRPSPECLAAGPGWAGTWGGGRKLPSSFTFTLYLISVV